MTIGALVKAALANDSGVSALVSARIYPNKLPQHPTYPAISYQRVSNSAQLGTTNLRKSRWQINCWAESYAGTQTLAAAVKALMEEYTSDQAVGIKMTEVVNELDDLETDVNDDSQVQRTIIDVMLTTTGD
jgi:hypothetical protein